MPPEQKQTANFMASYNREDAKLEAAKAEVAAAITKHYPTSGYAGDMASVMAHVFSLYHTDGAKEARDVYLEWTLERYVGQTVANNLDDVDALYDALVENGFDEKHPYEYNDGDDTLFYVPGDRKVFCWTGQCRNYIYIREAGRFHIRRYFGVYGVDTPWDTRAEEQIHDRGLTQAIIMADNIVSEYSDCVSGAQYPQRPSLKWFKDHDYRCTYNDGRDIGYVLSYNALTGHTVDWAIHNYTEITNAIARLRIAVEEGERGFDGC